MSPNPSHITASLFDPAGRRKYLTRAEGLRFIEAAAACDLPRRALAWLLLATGCRISEALALTRLQIDAGDQAVVFRTLKRRRAHFRSVPVPPVLIAMLLELAGEHAGGARLWPFSRQTAWRYVKAIMAEAGICGPQASPRGLRHAYGVACALAFVPPPVTQNAMGHSKPESTAVYQQITGPEAAAILSRLWEHQRLAP